MCNFCDPNLVAFYFYELKNTLLFVCSTNILVRLLTVNVKNCLTSKNLKMSDPILVNLAVKLRPYRVAKSLVASYKEIPPPPPLGSEMINVINKKPFSQLFLFLSLGN